MSEPNDATGIDVRAPLGVPLRLAVAATGVEALGLAASAIGLAVYRSSGHRPFNTGDLWAIVAMAAIGAIGLVLVVRGLARAQRWARSPSVLVQLIGLPIGVNAIGHGAAAFGIALLVCAVAGLVGLFAPSTSRRMSDV